MAVIPNPVSRIAYVALRVAAPLAGLVFVLYAALSYPKTFATLVALGALFGCWFYLHGNRTDRL